MNAYALLATELLISITISLAVLHTMSRPLKNVLTRICPDEQAAFFWLSYTRIMMLLAPLLLVLSVDLFTHFVNPMDTLRLASIAALGGLLVGLHAVGKQIGLFIRAPKEAGGES